MNKRWQPHFLFLPVLHEGDKNHKALSRLCSSKNSTVVKYPRLIFLPSVFPQKLTIKWKLNLVFDGGIPCRITLIVTENRYSPPFCQHEMSFDSRHLTGWLQCLVHVCDHQAMSLCISLLWKAREKRWTSSLIHYILVNLMHHIQRLGLPNTVLHEE